MNVMKLPVSQASPSTAEAMLVVRPKGGRMISALIRAEEDPVPSGADEGGFQSYARTTEPDRRRCLLDAGG
jgi:hypothetical protein